MGKKQREDDQKHDETSRSDALLSDYLEEMFASSASKNDTTRSGKSSSENKKGENAVKTNSPSDKVASAPSIAARPQASVTEDKNLVENKKLATLARAKADVDKENTESTEQTSRPRAHHLRPASKVIEMQSQRPYQEREPRIPKVVPSLMPKLQPKTTDDNAPETASVERSEPRKGAPKPGLQVQAEAKERKEEAERERPTKESEAQDNDVSPPEPPVEVPAFQTMKEFEMLLFEVRGLQLAVPLISLGSIHRLEAEFTPIVGRADWYLGMYPVNGQNLQVVDTARWVMPSRSKLEDTDPYQFVIRLADTNWALACSSVQQAVRISNEEIKWRTENSKRPWLAGTVISKMCALLDVSAMAVLLDQNKLDDLP